MLARRTRRTVASFAFMAFCTTATALALIVLVAILGSLIYNGIGGVNLDIFTKDTPATGSIGGLRNAIVGSILLCAWAMAAAIAVGVLAGTWLSEYAGSSRYGSLVRLLNDVLLSAPSILVGLFVYQFAVKPLHGFSGFAGAVALAVLAVPVVARTTEDVLRLQSRQLRESGAALGTPMWATIRKILWKAAGGGHHNRHPLGFRPHFR